MLSTPLDILCSFSQEGWEFQASPWQSAIKAPSLSLGEARQSLAERKIELLNVSDFQAFDKDCLSAASMAVFAGVLMYGIVLGFTPIGVPLPTTFYPCKREPRCNASFRFMPADYMDVYSPGMGFLSLAVLAYMLAHAPKIYRVAKTALENRQTRAQNDQSLRFNAAIDQHLARFPSARCDLQPITGALAGDIVDYLTDASLEKLSFVQLEAYREKNPLGFRHLLHETYLLHPQQCAYWHLLEHIEKAKDDPQEQERILIFPANLKLLCQEPHLFEKILKTVPDTLSDKHHLTFFEKIFTAHVLTEQTAHMLDQQCLTRKIIKKTASSRIRLEEALFNAMKSALNPLVEHQIGAHTLSMSPHLASLCEQREARADPLLLAKLSHAELQLFVDFLTSHRAKPTDEYTLLKATATFNLHELFLYFDASLAQRTKTWLPSIDLQTVLPEIEHYPCLLLKAAVNQYLSDENVLSALGQDLLPWIQSPYLAPTLQACSSYLKTQIARLDAVADPQAFALKLQSYATSPFQSELKATLLSWLLKFSSEGEALWHMALKLDFPWLQSNILECLKENPLLLSSWSSPPSLPL